MVTRLKKLVAIKQQKKRLVQFYMKVYTTAHIDYWYIMFCIKLFHAHDCQT